MTLVKHHHVTGEPPVTRTASGRWPACATRIHSRHVAACACGYWREADSTEDAARLAALHRACVA